MASASNKLAPGHKWSIAPTVSAGWLLSEEAFVQNLHWIDFLKLRASFGIISTDRLLLSDNTEQTNYWEQTYSGGNFYPFDTNYSAKRPACCRTVSPLPSPKSELAMFLALRLAKSS